MSLYVADLIKASMRVGRILRKDEEPDADEMNMALQSLTIMLHSWSARKLMVRSNVEEMFDVQAGINTYTIGIGGAFNTSKPYKITNAFIRDSNMVDQPLDIVPMEFYQSIMDKGITTSRPDMLVYDPGAAQQATQTGAIILYGIPDIGYKLGLLSQKPFTDFTSIRDKVTFDLPYEEAIKYELAVRLWPEYHKEPVSNDVYALANEAMHVVESMNSNTPVSVTDLPGVKRPYQYNIYVGSYSNG